MKMLQGYSFGPPRAFEQSGHGICQNVGGGASGASGLDASAHSSQDHGCQRAVCSIEHRPNLGGPDRTTLEQDLFFYLKNRGPET